MDIRRLSSEQPGEQPFEGGISMQFLRQTLGVLVFALCAIVMAGAQENAQITGIVTDASGAALPNATLVLTHVSTGSIRTTQSNSTGLFDFPGLRVGTYILKA